MSQFSLKDIENKAYIGGNFKSTETNFSVINPYTGEMISTSANCTQNEANEALSKAKECFHQWKLVSAHDRSKQIQEWAFQIRQNLEPISKLLTMEQGKPIYESRGEVLQGAVMMDWFAQESRRIHGTNLSYRGDDRRDFVLKAPIGVVFAITPWNFPFIAPIVKCAAAIAAGCTAILKPSEETPLVSMALAYCAHKAGLNQGQLSVLPCSTPQAVSDYLMAHSDVRMLSFTGSTRVGKMLYQSAAETIKKAAFELGGNAPFVVFEDADLEKATKCAKGARFYNNGQICLGANRIIVHEAIYDDFIDLLKEKVSKIQTGNGLDENINTGPLINQASLVKIQHLIQDALSKGASLICGGKAVSGLSFEPTILANTTKEMDAYHTELFGPVACVYKFKSEEEAIQLSNETPYGLAAYVFTTNHARLWRLSERIEAGMIGGNTTDITSDDLPFGGIKQSGYGREGGQGCLEEYLETKIFCLGL